MVKSWGNCSNKKSLWHYLGFRW